MNLWDIVSTKWLVEVSSKCVKYRNMQDLVRMLHLVPGYGTLMPASCCNNSLLFRSPPIDCMYSQNSQKKDNKKLRKLFLKSYLSACA